MPGSLKKVAERFRDGRNLSYTDGDWNIAKGGYDLWFEIYYKGIPKIQCIAGTMEVGNDRGIDAKKCLMTLKEVFPSYKLPNNYRPRHKCLLLENKEYDMGDAVLFFDTACNYPNVNLYFGEHDEEPFLTCLKSLTVEVPDTEVMKKDNSLYATKRFYDTIKLLLKPCILLKEFKEGARVFYFDHPKTEDANFNNDYVRVFGNEKDKEPFLRCHKSRMTEIPKSEIVLQAGRVYASTKFFESVKAQWQGN